ncbi:MAG: indole-3-glycerol phosphate synthase TrpC [Sediminibacterium sp.]|nr:indole-3-glycerol phosphate synthase TrpC [Sediminibacterium sp.]MBX9778899.1 indole-3-glycerol phosphate synthase TrpC [Chitinophagaceae bacterium]
MNILDTIVATKRKEVEEQKKRVSFEELSIQLLSTEKVYSLKENLINPGSTGIIAEFKRKSPSKGIINNEALVTEVTSAYCKYGAAAISVLTDQPFFGGSMEDLLAVTQLPIPVLRKDFMIDPYQILEAKLAGASVILLIAACLSPTEVGMMTEKAHEVGLEVLLEIHNEEELGHISKEIDLVGVNNRNLKDFSVNLEHSIRLSQKIPAYIPAIAESGIHSADTVVTLKRAGFKGFLMGEYFMKEASPAIAFANFMNELKVKQYAD